MFSLKTVEEIWWKKDGERETQRERKMDQLLGVKIVVNSNII